VNFEPGNILVMDFGQLGDVVLSLPALRALRGRFPNARITVAVGQPAGEIARLSGYVNEVLTIDRVGLRDGAKLISILKILQFVKKVRQSQFDLVVDLHSYYETNLLGFASGAPKRLYARRPTRSLDYLANFEPRPPREEERSLRHQVDCYLDVLIPLGVKDAVRVPLLKTRPEDDRAVEAILRRAKADTGAPLVGIFPGAGHPSRRWPLERFAELADYLVRNDGMRVLVFAGPEEAAMVQQMRGMFPSSTLILSRLRISELASALARLAVFVANDTGPMHVAAAVGTSVVVLLNRPTPNTFIPLGEAHRLIFSRMIREITTEQVYEATCELLASSRVAKLSSR
jgi:ADP-heptose:LPS heptosyltransferase